MSTEAFHSCLFRTAPSPITSSSSSSILIPLQHRSYRASVVCKKLTHSRKRALFFFLSSFINAHSQQACMGMRDEDTRHQINTERAVGAYDTWSSVSSFLEGECGLQEDSSDSLLGLSTSLFNDVNACVMDKEDPPEFIPAPIQSAADLELSKQVEDILYMLRDLLPGHVQKSGIDDKLLEAWKLVHCDVKLRDPLLCLEGKDKLCEWLRIMALQNAQVDLHDIYAERSMENSCKRSVYAIWTLLIPKEPAQPSLFEGVEISLSGESKFELDGNGQVVLVESKWYVPKGGEETFETIKKYLVSLLHKEKHS